MVALAVALSLPETMPGRDLILVSAFAVISVTVLQGATPGALIQLLGVGGGREEQTLTRADASSRVAATHLATVEALARDADGQIRHSRLLEQYGFRARAARHFSQDVVILAGERHAHLDVMLAAVAARRAEVLRLHRSDPIHDEVSARAGA